MIRWQVVRGVLALLLAASLLSVPSAPSASSVGAAVAPSPLRVLIVGDSVTQGSAGDFTWRYRLWQHLTGEDVSVDLVGPRDDLWDNVAQVAGSRDYVRRGFDRDHAARWGATVAFFHATDYRFEDLVTTYRPDVVLMMLGVNDLTYLGHEAAEVSEGLRTLVTQARSADPAISIVLGHLSQTWYDGVPELNALLDDLADELDESRARVTTAAVDEGYVLREHTWDTAHPNAQGEVLIAAAMADAMAELGLAPAYPRPVPTVPLGPRRAGVLTATAVSGGAALSWTGPPGADGQVVEVRDVTAGRRWKAGGGPVSGDSTTVRGLRPTHRYAVRLRPAKGFWVAARVRSNVVRFRPLPEPPARVRLRRVTSPAPDRVRVTAVPAARAASYRVQIAATDSCSARPVRYQRQVTGLAKPRTTFGTTAPYVRVRMVARNRAGDGRVSPASPCLRVR